MSLVKVVELARVALDEVSGLSSSSGMGGSLACSPDSTSSPDDGEPSPVKSFFLDDLDDEEVFSSGYEHSRFPLRHPDRLSAFTPKLHAANAYFHMLAGFHHTIMVNVVVLSTGLCFLP